MFYMVSGKVTAPAYSAQVIEKHLAASIRWTTLLEAAPFPISLIVSSSVKSGLRSSLGSGIASQRGSHFLRRFCRFFLYLPHHLIQLSLALETVVVRDYTCRFFNSPFDLIHPTSHYHFPFGHRGDRMGGRLVCCAASRRVAYEGIAF